MIRDGKPRSVCSMPGALHDLKIKPGSIVNGSLKGYEDYNKEPHGWQRSQSFVRSLDLSPSPSTMRTAVSTPTSHPPDTKPWYSLSRWVPWTSKR